MAKTVYIASGIYPLFTQNYLNLNKKTKRQKLIIRSTYCRNSVLLPFLLGKTFNVHNGRIFLKVHVSENIIGHKLGEFSQSRRRYLFKKGKKVKQKGKK